MISYSVNEQEFYSLLMMLENKDPYTACHQRRVARLAVAIAKDLKLNTAHIDNIYKAALLHDIGKLLIPTRILNKPSCLNFQELELMKLHPEIGARMLRMRDYLYPYAEIVLQHHEKIDGSGYPNGLYGGNILIEARIIGVVDVFDALVFPRPYRSGCCVKNALEEVTKDVEICYDLDAVNSLGHLLENEPLYLN